MKTTPVTPSDADEIDCFHEYPQSWFFEEIEVPNEVEVISFKDFLKANKRYALLPLSVVEAPGSSAKKEYKDYLKSAIIEHEISLEHYILSLKEQDVVESHQGFSSDDFTKEELSWFEWGWQNLENEQPKPERKLPVLSDPLASLPAWADVHRAVPNEFLRSALFTARKSKDRIRLNEEKIYTVGPHEIYYTGEELRQDDETVWMQILHYARGRPSNNLTILMKKSDFLREIGWREGGNYYKKLDECLNRLAATNLLIKSDRFKEDRATGIGVSLINRYVTNSEKNLIKVTLDPEIPILFFGNQYTLIEWKQRLSLPEGIARWLYGYYCTHAQPYPLKLETIEQGVGVIYTRKSDFKNAVRRALRALVESGAIKSFSVTRDDLVSVRR